MVNKTTKNERIIITVIGIAIVLFGWISIFSGFAGVLLAEDFKFFIQVEDFILVEQVITEESIVFSNFIRIGIGFFLVFIGNSIVVMGGFFKSSRFCHPNMNDVKEKINGK